VKRNYINERVEQRPYARPEVVRREELQSFRGWRLSGMAIMLITRHSSSSPAPYPSLESAWRPSPAL